MSGALVGMAGRLDLAGTAECGSHLWHFQHGGLRVVVLLIRWPRSWRECSERIRQNLESLFWPSLGHDAVSLLPIHLVTRESQAHPDSKAGHTEGREWIPGNTHHGGHLWRLAIMVDQPLRCLCPQLWEAKCEYADGRAQIHPHSSSGGFWEILSEEPKMARLLGTLAPAEYLRAESLGSEC